MPTIAELPAIHTIVQALARNAEQAPGRAAYVDTNGEISFGQLWVSARQRAQWMAQEGLRAGDTVALAFDADPAGQRRALELLYAAAFLGAVVLPLYPQVPQEACGQMMARLRAQWLIACGAPPEFAGARGLDPRACEAQWEDYDPNAAPRGDEADKPFLYNFTSGTSGSPKVVLFTHAQFCGINLAAARAVGMQPDDRQMPALPWPSTVALRYLMRAHMHGAAFINEPLAETREALARDLARYAVTRASASPWQLRRLVQSPAPGMGMPPLRSLHVTGAFIAPDELDAARAALTPNIYVIYGTIEAGATTLLLPGEAAPGCVGRLVEGMRGRVEDEKGNPLPPGQWGELGFSAPWMCEGYVDNPAASAAQFRNGWFFPRDIGCIDERGYVWLRGRSVEVINCGGLKIWPEEIEAVLKTHPAIADAAVAGLPDAAAGEVAVAFIVTRAPLVREELYAFCAARLDAGRIPQHLVVVPSIPRNEAGKVLRQELLAREHAVLEAARRGAQPAPRG